MIDSQWLYMQVQMLDKEHLLISMGPPDAGMTRDSGTLTAHNYCLLTWNTSEVPPSPESILPASAGRGW